MFSTIGTDYKDFLGLKDTKAQQENFGGKLIVNKDSTNIKNCFRNSSYISSKYFLEII
jgi:hypothetical protein